MLSCIVTTVLLVTPFHWGQQPSAARTTSSRTTCSLVCLDFSTRRRRVGSINQCLRQYRLIALRTVFQCAPLPCCNAACTVQYVNHWSGLVDHHARRASYFLVSVMLFGNRSLRHPVACYKAQGPFQTLMCFLHFDGKEAFHHPA